MNKRLLVAALVLGGLLFGVVLWMQPRPQAIPRTSTSTTVAQTTTTLAESLVLTVPYTVQAPYGNWTVHEESCEEAAVLMVQKYLEGQRTDIDPAEASQTLRAMKAWQTQRDGREKDLTIAEVGELAKGYYQRNFQLSEVSKESIKKALTAGHPVIVPVMTHALGNPHYGRENTYHVLVIKGYRPAGVIANDPGVKAGKDWFYSWEILFRAIEFQKVSPQNLLILTK